MKMLHIWRKLFLFIIPLVHVRGDNCLTANIGETVQIPCFLNTKESLKAEDISVEWTAGDGLVVYSFVKGTDKDQDPHFRGRAQLFKSELSRGNFSLSLSNVSEADDGQKFQCIYYNNRAQDNNRKDLFKHCLRVADGKGVPKEADMQLGLVIGLSVVLIALTLIIILMKMMIKKKKSMTPNASREDDDIKAPLRRGPDI